MGRKIGLADRVGTALEQVQCMTPLLLCRDVLTRQVHQYVEPHAEVILQMRPNLAMFGHILVFTLQLLFSLSSIANPTASRVTFLLTYIYIIAVVGTNWAMDVKGFQMYPVLVASAGLAVSVGLLVREISPGGQFLNTAQHLTSFGFIILMLMPRVRSALRERRGEMTEAITCPGPPEIYARSTRSAQCGGSRGSVSPKDGDLGGPVELVPISA